MSSLKKKSLKTRYVFSAWDREGVIHCKRVREGMVTCTHQSCGYGERLWLPTAEDTRSDARPHPWCVRCGLLKNISDDRPKKLGYWMNILAKISHDFSLKQCQRRLLSKQIADMDCFHDLYGVTFSSQQQVFLSSLKKLIRVNEQAVFSYFYWAELKLLVDDRRSVDYLVLKRILY